MAFNYQTLARQWQFLYNQTLMQRGLAQSRAFGNRRLIGDEKRHFMGDDKRHYVTNYGTCENARKLRKYAKLLIYKVLTGWHASCIILCAGDCPPVRSLTIRLPVGWLTIT